MGEKDLQNMSLDQIKSIMDVMQKASEAYLYILDLTSDIYMIPEKLTKRVALDSARIEHCTEALKAVIHPSDYQKVVEDIARCASGEQDVHDLEYRWLSRDNRVMWISCRGTVVTGTDGNKLLVGKITELGKKAKADNVTGLRRETRFRLNAEEILRDRPDSIRYCMRIGNDNFKEINEKDGAEAGDEILYKMSKCITDVVMEGVDVYRLVADEFMIMDTISGPGEDPKNIYKQFAQKWKRACGRMITTGSIRSQRVFFMRILPGRTAMS